MTLALRMAAVVAAATLSCTSSPSSNVVADCKAACARMAAPKCPATKPNCEEGCANLPAHCAAEVNAYVSCASTATFTCNAQGSPEAAACAASAGEVGRCLLTGGVDAGVSPRCLAICRSIDAQKCPGDANVDCGLGCQANVDFYASWGCAAENTALQDCQERATTWKCATDGAVAVGCESAQAALSTCFTTPKDAGADASDG